MRKYPLSDEEYKNIYSKATRLVVGLVIKNSDGILLTLRQANGWVGQWHIPGGMVHYRESIKDAIRRIAKEELGVGVSGEKLLGYIEYFSEQEERGYGYTVGMVFEVKPEHENFILDHDAEKYQFFRELPDNTVTEEKDFISSRL